MEQENATNYSTRQDGFGQKANHHPPRHQKLLLFFWTNLYFVWFPKSK